MYVVLWFGEVYLEILVHAATYPQVSANYILQTRLKRPRTLVYNPLNIYLIGSSEKLRSFLIIILEEQTGV